MALGQFHILNLRIGSFAFGQNSTISCISSSQESDLLFIGIDYPSGGGGEIVIFNPFLSIRLKRIRNALWKYNTHVPNIDAISGALITLSLSIMKLNSQCEEGAKDRFDIWYMGP